ncbi:hypothetical protein BAJUN_02790 [Bajunvirus bajun]|uniref:DUF2460 domain-containing protein n=1 Tax=Brevundimonas phage vB_BgoS-Bajun TaxID=2948594 RepID=A0A9E7SU84_9CAUD|nr:hypothetical protein BAJUN_02790 [Brevundimonas phage vB_BgoS-Bajun]
MSDFHEILFPPTISYGSSGGPRFKTTLFTTDAGYEQRNIDWTEVRHEYDVAHAMREFDGTLNVAGIHQLHAFFMARAGRSHGFRFKDWNDHRVDDGQVLGSGDGGTTSFQIIKTYYEKQNENQWESIFDRRITKVDWDSVITVRLDDEIINPMYWTLDYNTGILTFLTAPPVGASVTIDGVLFHVPVRFDTDYCDVTVEFWNGGSWPSIPLIELRQPNDAYKIKSLTLNDTIHEVLFPVGVSWGASGGPKFKTAIYTIDSGYEANVRDWTRTRAEYECSHEVKHPEQMKTLTEFFMNRRGMAYGFRYKDWSDYRLKQEKIEGKGNHAQKIFQITKTYRSHREGAEPTTYVRRITKLAWNTIAGVTVGGVVARQSNEGDWGDITDFTKPWYHVDVDKGKIEFYEAPAGRRYEGVTDRTPLTLITTGGLFTNSVATNIGGRYVYADPDAGYIYMLGGGGGQNGIRRVRMSDGVEDFQVRSETIGFPLTNVSYDDRKISSFVAAGNGFIYVMVGGFNTQVLYKIDLSDFSIAASRGTAAGGLPSGSQTSAALAPGAVSKDGTRVIHLGQLGGEDAVNVFTTEDLTPVRTCDVGGFIPIANNPLRAACPLYEVNFGILLSWDVNSDKGALVELWDDAGHKLLQFEGVGDWIARDDGATPTDAGVLVGWHDADGVYISKYSEAEQKEVWRATVPVQGAVSPQSRVAGHMAYAADDVIIHIDTTTGEVITRASEVDNFSSAQFYDRITDRIYGVPQINEVDGYLDTSVEGLQVLDAAEIVIGTAEFHVPVRFDSDQLDVTQDHFNVSSWPSISLVEIRDWVELGISEPPAPRGVKSPHTITPGKRWQTVLASGGVGAVAYYPTAYAACRRQWEEFANTERTEFIGATVLDSGNAVCMWSYIPADPLPAIVSLVDDV